MKDKAKDLKAVRRRKKITKSLLSDELWKVIDEYNNDERDDRGGKVIKPSDKIGAIKLLVDMYGMKEGESTDLKDVKLTLKI